MSQMAQSPDGADAAPLPVGEGASPTPVIVGDAPPKRRRGRPPKQAADTPPKTASAAPPKAGAGGRPSNEAQLARRLGRLLVRIGKVLAKRPASVNTGRALAVHGMSVAEALVECSATNKRLRQLLGMFDNLGGAGGLAVALWPLAEGVYLDVTGQTPDVIGAQPLPDPEPTAEDVAAVESFMSTWLAASGGGEDS